MQSSTQSSGASEYTRSAEALRDRFAELAAGWHRQGFELGLGIGVSVGFATLGRIGFDQVSGYLDGGLASAEARPFTAPSLGRSG